MPGEFQTIAAGIVFLAGLFATGLALAGMGEIGVGVLAQKPERAGLVLFFFMIPETLWVVGFILGVLLLLGVV